MLMFLHGMTFLHLQGRVWVDHSTFVTWQEWVAAGQDPSKLTWKHGQL